MARKRLDAHPLRVNSFGEPTDTEHSLGSTKFFLATASEASRQHQPANFIYIHQFGQAFFIELDTTVIFKHTDRKPMSDRRPDYGCCEPLTILEPNEELTLQKLVKRGTNLHIDVEIDPSFLSEHVHSHIIGYKCIFSCRMCRSSKGMTRRIERRFIPANHLIIGEMISP